MNPFKLMETTAFRVSDLLTGRNMLLLQMKRPVLYWCIAIPTIVLPIVAIAGAALWFDGLISFK